MNDKRIINIIVAEGFTPWQVIDFLCDYYHAGGDLDLLGYRLDRYFEEICFNNRKFAPGIPKIAEPLRMKMTEVYARVIRPIILQKSPEVWYIIKQNEFDDDYICTYEEYRMSFMELCEDIFDFFWVEEPKS
jgi:hypothetical protein